MTFIADWRIVDAIFPSLYLLSDVLSPKQAYVDLIERFGWRSYTILYEDNQGLVRLQELLKSPTQSDVKIVVRQLPSEEDYRSGL